MTPATADSDDCELKVATLLRWAWMLVRADS